MVQPHKQIPRRSLRGGLVALIGGLALVLTGAPTTAWAAPFHVTAGSLFDLSGVNGIQALTGELQFDGSTLTLNLEGSLGTTVVNPGLAMEPNAVIANAFDPEPLQSSTTINGIPNYLTSGSCQPEDGGFTCNFTFDYMGGGQSPDPPNWAIVGLTATPSAAVPEPSAALLFSLGALLFGRALRRRV